VAVGVLLLQGEGLGANSGVGAEAIQRFVVVPFENRTGDPAAADWAFTAAEFITRDIDRASVVNMVPASAVRDLAREVGSTAGLPLYARQAECRKSAGLDSSGPADPTSLP
jgi:hypothetical protein